MDTKSISTTLSKIQQTPAQSPELVKLPAGKNAPAEKDRLESLVRVREPANESEKQPVEQIKEAVEKLNTQALASSHTLKFSLDEKLGKAIISVVDRETNEVIRQIPPETALKISEAFDQVTSGQLLTELA